ncbi:fimbria/pilus periplasmic chaperone [Escherichia coli]|nr:fimbria/pilus periplasmic chaperone [Escherichia coli]
MAMAGIVVGGNSRYFFMVTNLILQSLFFNKETNLPYLLQTWVDPFNKEDKSKPPFSVIPPVSRIEPQQEKILRILKNGWRVTKRSRVRILVEREKHPSFN